MFPPRRCLPGITVALLVMHMSAGATSSMASELTTGRALIQALDDRRALTVQAIPLRDLLADLQVQTRISLVLDRRIDPSQRVTLQAELMPTRQLLQLITAEVPDAGLSVNRSFVYIGPTPAAQRLRTLCEINRARILESRREFRPDVYEQLSARREHRWHELSRPGELLLQLCRDVSLNIANPAAVPADLWHASRLAAMPFAESTTLLLNQFDLTFEIDAVAGNLSVVPVPQTVVMERRHVVPRRRRSEVEQQLPRLLANRSAEWSRTAVRVQATFEQHQQIAALIAGEQGPVRSPPPESLRTRVFTLSLPDGITWRSLISQLQDSGVPVRVEAELGDQLDRTVSVSLNRLPGSRFFPQLFSGLDVDVEVLDREVVLRPRNAVEDQEASSNE